MNYYYLFQNVDLSEVGKNNQLKAIQVPIGLNTSFTTKQLMIFLAKPCFTRLLGKWSHRSTTNILHPPGVFLWKDLGKIFGADNDRETNSVRDDASWFSLDGKVGVAQVSWWRIFCEIRGLETKIFGLKMETLGNQNGWKWTHFEEVLSSWIMVHFPASYVCLKECIPNCCRIFSKPSKL